MAKVMSIVLSKAELFDFYHVIEYYSDRSIHYILTTDSWRRKMEEAYLQHETFCLVFKDIELRVLYDIMELYSNQGGNSVGVEISRNILRNLRGF